MKASKTKIDFSKFRKGSKPRGRVIDYCPKCGRKGERTAYQPKKNSDKRIVTYTHSGHVEGPFFMVDDYCTISEEQQKGL